MTLWPLHEFPGFADVRFVTVSIAASPLFPNLHRFPHGRHFKQWTGDDSKALMKVRQVALTTRNHVSPLLRWQVYMPAIAGHVPLR